MRFRGQRRLGLLAIAASVRQRDPYWPRAASLELKGNLDPSKAPRLRRSPPEDSAGHGGSRRKAIPWWTSLLAGPPDPKMGPASLQSVVPAYQSRSFSLRLSLLAHAADAAARSGTDDVCKGV